MFQNKDIIRYRVNRRSLYTNTWAPPNFTVDFFDQEQQSRFEAEMNFKRLAVARFLSPPNRKLVTITET